jgi:FixJ family two-component response regulator
MNAVAEPQKTVGKATVFVVEDNPAMRSALSSVIRSVDLRAEAFATATDFLRHQRQDGPSCLVVDVRLPGMSGFDLQSELAKANDPIPMIFITSHADVPMCARAMKAGAIEFLPKPFRDQDLLDAIQCAIRRDTEALARRTECRKLRALYEELTPRECEVMRLCARGLLNKQVAAELGTTEVTVKIQRAHAMRKMGAQSIADLVRMSERLGLLA